MTAKLQQQRQQRLKQALTPKKLATRPLNMNSVGNDKCLMNRYRKLGSRNTQHKYKEKS